MTTIEIDADALHRASCLLHQPSVSPLSGDLSASDVKHTDLWGNDG